MPSRILIVLPNWVGDLVLATPALRAIRVQFPAARITGLVKSPLADVLAGGDWLDELIFWPTGKSKPKRRQSFLGLAAQLRDERFDLAILFSNTFRSALLARLAGIKRRVGYNRDGRGLLLTDKLLPEKYDGKYIPVSMIRYYNSIARYLGCRECPTRPELYATPDDERALDAALQNVGVKPDQPIVLVNPGASFGPAKCWLPDRFAKVADSLAKERGAAVVLAPGPKELDIARQVARHMSAPAKVLDNPVLRLGPLKALVKRSALLLTNDTGPRHFANAFGVPVVTIFGPTHPEWTATPTTTEATLQVKVDCGPCMKRECPLDHRCMTRITSEMVLASARKLLAEQGASAGV